MLSSIQLKGSISHLLVKFSSLDACTLVRAIAVRIVILRQTTLPWLQRICLYSVDKSQSGALICALHGRDRQHDQLLLACSRPMIASHLDCAMVVQLLLVELVEVVVGGHP